MRLPVLILLAGLTVGAAACATVEHAPTTVDSASAPAALVGHDWFYHQDEEEARLAYGLAESDDLRLGLDCAKASGRLMLSALRGPDAKPEFHLEAGGETERFPARAEPSELDQGTFLTAEAAAGAAVFRRFRSVGWIASWQDGERQTYAPHAGSAPNIERFFAFCG